MAVELLAVHFTSLAAGGIGVCCIAVVLYVIYSLSIKEKSFEEVLEEQRKRNLELELQQKQEKAKKEKEKKHKKWPKRGKEKAEAAQEKAAQEKPVEVDLKQLPPTINEIEIIEPKEVVPPTKKKSKSSGQKQASTPPSVPLSVKMAATTQKQAPEVAHPPQDTEKKGKSESIVKEKEKSNEDLKIGKTAQASDAGKPLPEAPVPVTAVASSTTSKKKKKVEQSDKDAFSQVTSGKLIALVKDAALGDEESQMLIDILLNKQKEASGWKKVNDPQAVIKRQLQEKEQALEQEQRQNQAATSKLKQDLVQERNKVVAIERKLQEKISAQAQELQSLTQRLKQAQEQLTSEKTSSQEKLKQLEKTAEEAQEAALKKLKEENAQLSKSIKRLESESRVAALTTEAETAKKSRDELQKVHNLLIEQHTQLISSHKREILNLNAKVSEANKLQQEAGEKNAVLTQELESLKKKLSEVEAAKKRFEHEIKNATNAANSKVEKLESLLEEAKAHSLELENKTKHLTAELAEVSAENKKLLQNVEDLQIENEKLCGELAESNERVAGDGQEMVQHNGEINGKAEEQKFIESQEKILQEKETVLKQLYDDINVYKSKISSLNDELDQQKQKNNELREKNWKVMDALTAAEKAAEQKVAEVEKSAIEKVKQVQKEAEEKLKYLQESSKSQEEVSERLREAEEKLKQLKETHSAKMMEYHALLEKNAQLSSEVEQLHDLHSTLESKVSESLQKVETIKAQMSVIENNSRACLQRIFPTISVDSSLSYEDWLSQFEKEVSRFQSSSHSHEEVEELLARFSDLRAERDSLSEKLSQYESVLADTETTLNRLQDSAKVEEAVWAEKLHHKEEELNNLQDQLKQLQNKLEDSNCERNSIEQKYEEVNKNYLNLQHQIEVKDKAISELQAEIASVDRLKQELEDMKSKLEKEKKISKDFSAQMVRLSSLVKIGQDSLEAEQETVRKLQSQLQEVKASATANGTSSPAISEQSDSHAKAFKAEKVKKTRKLEAPGKK